MINFRRLRCAGHVERMEEGRSVFKILTCTPAGERALRRPRRRWENNIRMELKKNRRLILCSVIYCIN